MLQGNCNGLDDSLQVLENFVVPEPHDCIAAGFQESCTQGVPLGLLGVLSAIQLDNQFAPLAGEIHYKGSDRDLTAEMGGFELLPAQPRPQFLLGFGGVLAQPTGAGQRTHAPPPGASNISTRSLMKAVASAPSM